MSSSLILVSCYNEHELRNDACIIIGQRLFVNVLTSLSLFVLLSYMF